MLQRSWLVSLLVNNHFGVLARVSGLFGRRGYNIASLSVGETCIAGMSRVTIETRTDEPGVRQVMQQLRKLEDVRQVSLLSWDSSVVRELLLAKLSASPAQHEQMGRVLADYQYRVPHADEVEIVVEFTGTPSQCDRFLESLSAFNLLELCRTGITAMST